MKQEIDPRFQQVLKRVESYCLDHENPDNVSRYAHYFREGYDAFGLTEEEVHALRDELVDTLDLSAEETAELGWHLFRSGKYEYGTIAILLLKEKKEQFTKEVFAWVKRWFDKGVENWAHSDMLCNIITPAFLEQEVVEIGDFDSWRDSESKWTRRAVPVTLLVLRKTAEPQELLDYLDPMMMDEARVVHQGLGWFLRELWKLHNEPVEEFLAKHKDSCARLIIQYATEKMKTETKESFRRTKSHKPQPVHPHKPHQAAPRKPAHEKPVAQQYGPRKPPLNKHRLEPKVTPPPKKKKLKPNKVDA